MFWVSTHRVHHQLSDQDGDPHTPREGAWWAHTGWILVGNSLHAQAEFLNRYSPDLGRDRFHVWLSKFHWIPLVASGVVLFAVGWLTGGPVNAIGWLLWGAFLRVTLGLHATWLVNSATHLWAAGVSKPATTHATAGGWRCSPAARDGTTIIMPTRYRRGMDWPGTNLTRTSGESGSCRRLAWRGRFTWPSTTKRTRSPRERSPKEDSRFSVEKSRHRRCALPAFLSFYTSRAPASFSSTATGAVDGSTVAAGSTRNVCSSANWPASTACGTVSV